uniref:Uncharacterized protein n=1 Tax=Parascaris univalens TaxID=6257 RepID=A0A915BG79_PARUN
MLSAPLNWLLLQATLSLLSSLVFSDYFDFSSAGKYCYSCMSEAFQKHWTFLEQVYYKPVNFTDHCYSMPTNVHIGITPCAHSMCVTMVEPRILAGHHVGNNVIRGCFSSVFKYGQTPRTQGSPVLDTACSRMPAHRLLPPHLARRSSNRTVELCWCVGQLCNDYPSASSAAMQLSLPPESQLLLISFTYLCSLIVL